MILRSTDIGAALRRRAALRRVQRGFLLNPFRFGGGSDPSFSTVQLLLHFDGTNGSTTFTDSSGTPKTITANGGAVLTTSSPKYGSAALDVSASGRYAAITNVSALRPGTGEFTIEGWVNPTLTGTEKFIFTMGINENAGFMIACSQSEVRFRDNSTTDLTYTTAISGWTHIVCQRRGGQKEIFVAGTKYGSTQASSSDVDTNTGLELGSPGGVSGSFRFTGYVDDWRYTVGVGRYTGNFTPPAAAFPNS